MLKPVIAITMGDPAGIGPEIVLKALADGTLNSVCVPVIVGDFDFLKSCAESLNIDFEYSPINKDEISRLSTFSSSLIVDLKNISSGLVLGDESEEAGKAAGEYIEFAVGLCESGKAAAVATAPINKRSFNLGGYDYPGHTEFLAELTGTQEFSMSFFAEHLRVVLLSTHVSLEDAIGLVKKENLVRLIRFTDSQISKLLGKSVKIAVAGLNPHASENGMFGNEEEEEILPAVLECRSRYGIKVSGPYSPDTVFLRGHNGEFDAVVACYHDQATIAVKCLSFGNAVNVTLGLPIIRTSVDHGTAFEIVGKNRADCGSMRAAIEVAAELAAIVR